MVTRIISKVNVKYQSRAASKEQSIQAVATTAAGARRRVGEREVQPQNVSPPVRLARRYPYRLPGRPQTPAAAPARSTPEESVASSHCGSWPVSTRWSSMHVRASWSFSNVSSSSQDGQVTVARWFDIVVHEAGREHKTSLSRPGQSEEVIRFAVAVYRDDRL